jgi:hypothetical protein
LEAGVRANGIERGFDGKFGHGERTLFVGLFKGIKSFGLLAKLGIESRGANGRVVGFGWIDGESREIEELLPVALRAARGLRNLKAQGLIERRTLSGTEKEQPVFVPQYLYPGI